MNDLSKNLLLWVVVAVVLMVVFQSFSPKVGGASAQTATYSEFLDQVDTGNVKQVTFSGDSRSNVTQVQYTLNNGQKVVTNGPYDRDLVNVLRNKNVEILQDAPSSGISLGMILLNFLPVLLIIGFWLFIMRQMQGGGGGAKGAMSFGKSRAKLQGEDQIKVTFADVAGCDEAKEEVSELVEFLRDPTKFQKLGGKIPRGVLMVGQPGTGKTLLAKAIAGEAKVPFFSISGSDFVEMFVGVGASRVRDLFEQAKEAAPAIVFIDEIDAVGRHRGAGMGGGHDEREQTLNQLLVEMDGFEDNSAVIMIAATNRPDILDPALLRPGRFDRRVTVDRPDVAGREKILTVHSTNKPLADDVDIARIAKLTPGFTGADLANLMNEAALLAARFHKDSIGMLEVEEAMERVIAGPERKSRVITPRERKVIAYHESGHALVGHVLESSDPIHKISIVARGQALGYTMQLPEEDHFLETRNGMLDQIAVLLGGRTAEELFCDDVTTGASNDLERATKIAREMVTRYGMSEELGTQVFGEAQHEVFLGRDYAQKNDYSAETAKRIDDEIERIMREAHDRAREVLSARGDQMRTMAEVLLERETVEGPAVDALLDGTWDQYVAEHPEEGGKPKTAPGQIDEDLVAEAAATATERESQ